MKRPGSSTHAVPSGGRSPDGTAHRQGRLKRRRPIRTPFLRSLLAFRLVLAAVVAASLWGFIDYTRITLRIQQQHLAPGMEHPYDIYGTGCLVIAILALILYYLTRAEAQQPRFWTRIATARAWAAARPADYRGTRLVVAAAHHPRRRRKHHRFRQR